MNTTADHEFLVTVPPFVWIGEEGMHIDHVIDSDGVLSAFTAQLRQREQFNAIVDDDLKTKHLEGNQQALRDQTEYYFTKLATSIDPDAVVKFKFTK